MWMVFTIRLDVYKRQLVGQCAYAAVALEGAFAYLEQHAQILIFEKADAFRDLSLIHI